MTEQDRPETESQEIPLDLIDIGTRLRAYRPEHVNELVASIEVGELIEPLMVVPLTDGRYRLATGRHRLEAVRQLGWPTVPARVRHLSEDDAVLAEIDENLIRKTLTILERAEHLFRRDEILRRRGARQGPGRPTKNPPIPGGITTTADLGDLAGVSAATVRSDLGFVRKLGPAARDLLRPSRHANDATTLGLLAQIQAPEAQTQAAQLLATGEAGGVMYALFKVGLAPCPKCRKLAAFVPGGVGEPCVVCSFRGNGRTPIRTTPTPPGRRWPGGPSRRWLADPIAVPSPDPNAGATTAPAAGTDVATAFAEGIEALLSLDPFAVAAALPASAKVQFALRALRAWLSKFEAPGPPSETTTGDLDEDVT